MEQPPVLNDGPCFRTFTEATHNGNHVFPLITISALKRLIGIGSIYFGGSNIIREGALLVE